MAGQDCSGPAGRPMGALPGATPRDGRGPAAAAGRRRALTATRGPHRRPPAFVAALLAALSLLASAGCVVGSTEVRGGRDAAPAGEPPAASSEDPPRAMEREIFDRVNAEREERGLEPVAWDDTLAELARGWSREMAQSGELRHQDLGSVLQDGQVEGYASLGENIFSSTGPVPAGRLHEGWMRSEDHRGNVLEPGWDRLGIGVVCVDGGATWATQEFGRTRGADRPPLVRETPQEDPVVRDEPTGPSC